MLSCERMKTRCLNRNGGWCWFQDERALVRDGRLLVASVAGTDAAGASAGDVQLTSAPLGDLSDATTVALAEAFQPDDHDVPALLELQDGRVAAFYQTHGPHSTEAGTTLMRWRIARNPGDPTAWGPERTLEVPGSISYANPFVLPDENGRLYNFFRVSRKTGGRRDKNPCYAVSDYGGETFRFGGRFLFWQPEDDDPKFTGMDGGRPYIKYASNGRDTIHFITSEDHPRAYDNSLYHGFLRGGVIHRSDGAPLGPLPQGEDPGLDVRCLTRIYEGGPDNVAWPVDFHLDGDGHPVALFSIQKDGAAVRHEREPERICEDHRFALARWSESGWRCREIAFAGSSLYKKENDYTGLAALHPGDLSRVVLSTNADPKTNEPLISSADGRRHHELFVGADPGDREAWDWRALTENSACDQLRPVIPVPEEGRTALLWLAGEYGSYKQYNLRVMGAEWPGP